jgi:hydrogenase nickel incorporation protein HypB
MKIKVSRDILKANDLIAQDVRSMLDSARVFAVNLLGSPGAGKTTLLEATIRALKTDLRIAVVEGDVQTAIDGERVEKLGVPVVQINTLGGCHLSAPMVSDAIGEFDLTETDLLFIENVGNLVCTATFGLGEDMKVTLLSVPEGDDKVQKYPTIFANSRVLVITKTDLLPHMEFDVERVEREARALNPEIQIVRLSARTGEGVGDWIELLRAHVADS